MADNSRPSATATDVKVKKSGAHSFLVRLTTISSLGGLLFGFDTGVISGALIYMREDLGLSGVQEGLVVTSLLLPGATSGALLGGPLADRIGRRLSLVICAVLFTIGAIGCALSPDAVTLIIARIVLGFAVGYASVVCPLYLAEMAPADRRGRVVTINQLMIVVGLFLSFSTNVLLDHLVHGPHVWRYMIGIAAVPAIALFVGMLRLPDSPRWYASKGRLGHCLDTLRLAHEPDVADFEHRQIVEIVQRDALDASTAGHAIHQLRAHPWMRRILWIGIVLAIAQQTTGINVVMYYAPSVLANSGLTNSASLVASLVIGIELIAFTVLGLWLLGFMPRRRMMFTGFSGIAVSHSLLALSYALPESAMRSYLILAFMVGVSAFMTCLIGTTGFVVLSEIFPLPIRGFAMGAAISALWITNAIISFSFPLLAEHVGAIPIFLTFMMLNILAVLFVARFIPETKDRTLEELEIELGQR
jgi:major inositol transporter-like SP family MFS transporter